MITKGDLHRAAKVVGTTDAHGEGKVGVTAEIIDQFFRESEFLASPEGEKLAMDELSMGYGIALGIAAARLTSP